MRDLDSTAEIQEHMNCPVTRSFDLPDIINPGDGHVHRLFGKQL
jgi:hypothetical protein